jgi:hypothetical protein
MTPITHQQRLAAALRDCLGRWHGRGHGEYPTIETFTYREELDLAMREGDATLRYEQRTWRLSDGGEVPSHWEVGLLWMDRAGGISLSSAQVGRTEALQGTASEDGEAVVLELASVGYGLDERVAAARRTIRLSPDAIDYQMSMATQRVPDILLHLRDRLSR